MDRLSRLNGSDWNRLKDELRKRQVKVVALDLPTSWMMATQNADDVTDRMFQAINDMMLDMLAAIARKDYEDRRRRQAQGIAKAKAERRYRGRPENVERNQAILQMLQKGHSWNSIVAATGCSRSTLARLKKRSDAAGENETSI